MQLIDEARLETDVNYRAGYLMEFMGFTSEDVAAIHAAAVHLAPLVPRLVDAVYNKLFTYNATLRHFLPRQHGYSGPLPQDLESLSQDHEQIQFRKQHLARYLTRLVTAPYDGKMLDYLDMVGKIHTHKAGNPQIDVPLVQMNALLGFVADALIAAIFALELPPKDERRIIRAFNKLLWLQNDLINRHYAAAGRSTPSLELVHAD